MLGAFQVSTHICNCCGCSMDRGFLIKDKFYCMSCAGNVAHWENVSRQFNYCPPVQVVPANGSSTVFVADKTQYTNTNAIGFWSDEWRPFRGVR